MKTVGRKRIIAGLAASAAVAAPIVLGAGTAEAFVVQQVPGGTIVWLDHDETVKAAHIGLVRFLDQPGLRDHTRVHLRPESRYYKTLRPVSGGNWAVTGASRQQIVDEVASKPDGQVGVKFSGDPDNIIDVIQYWPSTED